MAGQGLNAGIDESVAVEAGWCSLESSQYCYLYCCNMIESLIIKKIQRITKTKSISFKETFF